MKGRGREHMKDRRRLCCMFVPVTLGDESGLTMGW